MARGRDTSQWEIEEAGQHFAAGLKVYEVAAKMDRSLNWAKRAKLIFLDGAPKRGQARVHFQREAARKVPPEVLADRDRRMALEYTTVTAEFFGDPIAKNGRSVSDDMTPPMLPLGVRCKV